MAGAVLAARALMSSLGTVLSPFFLAATLTGTCASAPLLAYSMWYCRGRTPDRFPQS